MIVADINLLAYFWIEGELTADAQKVFETDSEWCAPILWPSEFRNLLLRFTRKNLFSMHMAMQLLRNVEKQMQRHSFPMDSDPVMALANQSTCSAYDCEYVALAKQLNAPLITSDRKILSQFPSIAMGMTQFSA